MKKVKLSALMVVIVSLFATTLLSSFSPRGYKQSEDKMKKEYKVTEQNQDRLLTGEITTATEICCQPCHSEVVIYEDYKLPGSTFINVAASDIKYNEECKIKQPSTLPDLTLIRPAWESKEDNTNI